RIDRIPKTRHRWIKIVSLLTSLGFNLKTKLRTKKSIQNTVFTECLHSCLYFGNRQPVILGICG
ncbi:MAG TPA: hypothetical protein VIK55_14350, partial [Paludibacter sp.]